MSDKNREAFEKLQKVVHLAKGLADSCGIDANGDESFSLEALSDFQHELAAAQQTEGE
jgi:hypothetical protein